jgi:DNA mismatch endonuclease, patch repair protein
MKANRKTDTQPELALRSALHARGLRYRADFPIRVPGRRLVRVDIAFPRQRIAVFVDGCFWHCCPDHGTTPSSNEGYWGPKLKRNVERDREVDSALAAHGWTPMHIWEHVDAAEAAATIERSTKDAARSGGALVTERTKGGGVAD